MARYAFSTVGTEIIIITEHGLQANEPRWVFYRQSTDPTDNTHVEVAGHGPAYSTADDATRAAKAQYPDLDEFLDVPEGQTEVLEWAMAHRGA